MERALIAALLPEGLDSWLWASTSSEWTARLAGAHWLPEPGWPSLPIQQEVSMWACVPVPGPNSRPWEHLSDLAALTSQLKRRLG
jgi:hypothetical protein